MSKYTINTLATYGLRPVAAVMRQLLRQLIDMRMYDVTKSDRTRYGSYSPGAFMLHALDALADENIRNTIKYAAMSAALAGSHRNGPTAERSDLIEAGLPIIGGMYKDILTAADLAAAQQAVKTPVAEHPAAGGMPRYADLQENFSPKKEPRRRRVRRRDTADKE